MCRHAACFLLTIAMGIAPAFAEPDTDEVREAVEKGLELVQKAARNYPKHRDCFSCHHQTLPMLAMDLAATKGLAVDADEMANQARFTWDSFTERRASMNAGKGVGGAAMTVGYGLWALHIAKWKPDDTTEAMVHYLLQKQHENGSWQRRSRRPPLEDSHFTCTILAAYYADKFATEAQKPLVEAATQRAREWVLKTKPESHEDRVSLLGALALLRAPKERIAQVRDEIFAAQHDDGSWGQLEDMEGDAYATGFTLFTLHRVRVPTSDPHFQRGVEYLVKTQLEDGSWHVATRSKPIQEFFDNGDPHGEDQFISTAATSWATAALSLAIPGRKAAVYQDDGTKQK